MVSLIFAAPLGMTAPQAIMANIDALPFKFGNQGESTLITTTVILYAPVTDAAWRTLFTHQVDRVRILAANRIIRKNALERFIL